MKRNKFNDKYCLNSNDELDLSSCTYDQAKQMHDGCQPSNELSNQPEYRDAVSNIKRDVQVN